jgi:hypothetical protein
LIPSTRFPPDDGIPGTWLILTLMVTSMVQQQLAGIRSGGLPIWWWDPRIHLSDRLIQMMVDRAVTVIGLLYFWDVSRGEVETYSIWQDRLEAGHGFAGLDLTETPSQGRIQDSGFSPFREFSLGFQERRMQTGHIGLMMMIRVVHHVNMVVPFQD